MRAQLSATAPVPASFRADAIAAFNKANGGNNEFNLIMVGVPGREIKTKPTDGAMAAAVESFTRETAPQPVSEFLTVGGQQVFRTVYPSLAGNESCVDCHNQIQAGQPIWHLNDVMGAFAIDVPMGPFLRTNLLESAGLGAATFTIVAALGLAFAIFQYRKTEEHDRAAAMLADSEARFRDFAESTSDWFWEQDENLRLSASCAAAISRIADTKDLGKTRRETATLGVSTEQWVSHDADLAARRPFHNFRFQRALADGRIIHVSVSGKPIFDATGKFRGYRGAGRDVTAEVAVEVELARRVEERTAELKAAQSELVRKERLSALGQLTATMAHELRNPLSAIRNTLFAVKETAGASGPDLERPTGPHRAQRRALRPHHQRSLGLHPHERAAPHRAGGRSMDRGSAERPAPARRYHALAESQRPVLHRHRPRTRCAACSSTSWRTLSKPCPRAAANAASRSAARSSTTSSSSRCRTPASAFLPTSCPRCSSRCSAPRASAPA